MRCPRPQASKLAVAVSLVPLTPPLPDLPWRPQACPDTWTSLEPLQGQDLVSLSFRVSSLGPACHRGPISACARGGALEPLGQGWGGPLEDSST